MKRAINIKLSQNSFKTSLQAQTCCFQRYEGGFSVGNFTGQCSLLFGSNKPEETLTFSVRDKHGFILKVRNLYLKSIPAKHN